jgi:hypothetical protein
MLGKVFERFVDHSPISVMVRGTLERVLGADPLDLWYERTARKQDARDSMQTVWHKGLPLLPSANSMRCCVAP